MAQEHRVVLHIGASQVQQPGQVIQRGNPVVGGALGAHLLAHTGQLVGTRRGSMGQGVLVHRRRGQAGAVGPDAIQHVHLCEQLPAGRTQCVTQLLGLRQAHHRAVHGQGGLRGTVRAGGLAQSLQPAHIGGRGRTFQLHQGHAAAGQFGLGLFPIAAVREQRRLRGRHQQRARRAGEAAQPHPALPPLRQVLRQMRVAAGHQHRLPVLLHHACAQGLQTRSEGSGGGGRGSSHGEQANRSGGIKAESPMLPRPAQRSRRPRQQPHLARSQSRSPVGVARDVSVVSRACPPGRCGCWAPAHAGPGTRGHGAAR